MRDSRFEWLDAEIAAGRGEHPGELHMLFGGPPAPEPNKVVENPDLAVDKPTLEVLK